MENSLKKKLSKDDNAIGCFVSYYCPPLVEIIGYSGYDFIIIDDEHGAFSYSEISEMVRVAKMAGLTPIVRVSYDSSAIQKVLDQGALGIQVPMVNDASQAKAIVNKAKYPPEGSRGVSYSIPSAKYGYESGSEFLNKANSNNFIAVQIETREAVENFNEILDVPGIDAVFIGTTDLSVNMGYATADDPEIKKVVTELIDKGAEKNIKVGLVAPNTKAVKESFQAGADYVSVVTNTVIKDGLSHITQQM
jgi:4-hydroxy-2-oxoheptanedioate aldolase